MSLYYPNSSKCSEIANIARKATKNKEKTPFDSPFVKNIAKNSCNRKQKEINFKAKRKRYKTEQNI
jgi:hypothetical protein